MTHEHAWTIHPMSREDAAQAASWRYEPPYEMYNPDSAALAEDIAMYTNPDSRYFGLRSASGELVAYLCFGDEARVPGGNYDSEALDVGCGLRPDLTGRHLGPEVIETAVAFGRDQYHATRFRATIAAFNQRALKAAQRAGFVPVGTFERAGDGRPFVILER